MAKSYEEERARWVSPMAGREARTAAAYLREIEGLHAVIKCKDDDNRRLQAKLYEAEDEVRRLKREHPVRATFANALARIAERLGADRYL